MSPRSLLLLVMALAVTAVGAAMPGASSATFTARTTNSSSSVTASDDWTPPAVTMTGLAAVVAGSVAVAGAASDAETGIAQVVFEYASTGAGAWNPICTDTTAPYTCSWNTVALGDGSYDLRARATDNAGYSAVSSKVTTSVANAARVTLTDPGDVVRGTILLTATAYNTGSVKPNIRVEYRPTGTTAWNTICSANSVTTLSCSVDTTQAGQTEEYDLRAVAVVGSTTYVDVTTAILVDNNAPTVSMTDPGSPLSGTRTFAATATDGGSGVAGVVLEYAKASGGPWVTMCEVAASPFSCPFDTTSIADGGYNLRATATDVAGNSRTAALGPRTVNNTVASVSVADPGAYLSGIVTLTANAGSSNGVASVAIHRAPSGGAFSSVCTDTAAPYTCAWNTAAVADGLYDLRAVLTDTKGNTLTSTVVVGRRVDNSPLRGADVQAVNSGSTTGRLETGDKVTFTYTREVAPGSILAGWSGTTTQIVSLRLRDGTLGGLSGNEDLLDVGTAGGLAVNLGSVNLKRSYVKGGRTVTFANSQMTSTVSTVNGVPRTIVTITLGTGSSSSDLSTASGTASMAWTPSTAAVSLVGQACSAALVTESGATDRDF